MILPQPATRIWAARSWASLTEITDGILETPPRLWPNLLAPLPGVGELRIPAERPLTLADALTEVKTMVRVAAHTRTRLVHNALVQVLIFDQDGPYAGSIILLSGEMTYQLALPLFNVCDLPSTRRNCF